MDEALKVYADPTGWPERFRGPLEGAVEDCRWFAHLARQFQLEERWQQLAETWEGFCQDKLGYPAEFVAAVIAGVQALGEQAPIPIQKAADEGRRVRAEKAEEVKAVRRDEPELTVREIAEKCGIPKSTAHDYLSEKNLIKRNSDKRTASQMVSARQVYLPAQASIAARKIIAKLGDEFAGELAMEILKLVKEEAE